MSNNLSQEDIDRLLAGLPSDDSAEADSSGGAAGTSDLLNTLEVEQLAELYNISMTVAANTLTEILDHKATISYPTIVDFQDITDVLSSQEHSTLVEIKYLTGMESSAVLLIKNSDVAIIADLMMGGTGLVDSDDLGEIQLSAAAEAMNQMMGSAATNLSSILKKAVEISPPKIFPIEPGSVLPQLSDDLKQTPVLGVIFKLNVGSLIDSELIQLISVDAAKTQLALFKNSGSAPKHAAVGHAAPAAHSEAQAPRMFGSAEPQSQAGFAGAPQFAAQQPLTVQPARFASFDNTSSTYGMENQNLDLVLDVGLKLTVELGRSELPIKKVLELTRGSVIELDKVAGEPVDLLANGKLIAKGEVVVIEDNFGLRITSIISPADRLKNL